MEIKQLTGIKVEVMDMLDARDYRAYLQRELITHFHKTLVCFTMNIAGPVKNNPLICQGFHLGLSDLKKQFLRNKLSFQLVKELNQVSGFEAFIVTDGDAYLVKKLCTELEDIDSLGRLYDLDVFTADGHKIDRTELGLSGRSCLICGKEGKDCASRRLHKVEELQEKTASILYKSLKKRYKEKVAELACRSLLYEVSVTPKPGLVDRLNNGSHEDMDFYTFLRSSISLYPYFSQCLEIGIDTSDKEAKESFQALRMPGIMAENHMLSVTDGINTHKGAIFSLGILCGALGRILGKSFLQEEDALPLSDRILYECKEMTRGLTESDFSTVTKENADTFGKKLYLLYGITGVRGQAEAGFPSVRKHGLPLLKDLLSEGLSEDEAGALVLLSLMANTTDTNMIHRGSMERLNSCKKEASILLKHALSEIEKDGTLSDDSLHALKEMDQSFIRENLSPGGSADLLALCWFLYFVSCTFKKGDEAHV